MKIIEIPAILTGVSLRKDNGMALRFTTNELAKEEKAIIQEYYQKFGYLLFKENQFQESEIPKENVEDKTKSPSKRLRAVLYVWYQQLGSTLDFEVFYREKMEDLINFIKRKFDK